jgi:hypothetical protein
MGVRLGDVQPGNEFGVLVRERERVDLWQNLRGK